MWHEAGPRVYTSVCSYSGSRERTGIGSYFWLSKFKIALLGTKKIDMNLSIELLEEMVLEPQQKSLPMDQCTLKNHAPPCNSWPWIDAHRPHSVRINNYIMNTGTITSPFDTL